jgi:hypothetical protein
MKNRIPITSNTYLRLLLMVPAICLLGFTACSSLDAGAGQKFHAAFREKVDPQPNGDADVVAANRDWLQMNH